jgi:hypothetical protein
MVPLVRPFRTIFDTLPDSRQSSGSFSVRTYAISLKHQLDRKNENLYLVSPSYKRSHTLSGLGQTSCH